ncbi:MAG: hypothetical protein EOO62_27375 [Hymenobacter sp.]|nr:MAG: hypothetical protein EOO62_27375 [Hymenobacter sp.]
MTAFRLMGSALLLSLPLLGHAQATEFAPRYYVGLAAYSSGYQRLGGNYYQSTSIPVQLILGYQLRPRLAMQLGVTYSGNASDYAGIGSYYYHTPATPYYYDYTSHSTWRNTSLTVLARYTLTRKPTHHVQFDALGGLGVEIQRISYSEVRNEFDSTRTIFTRSDFSSRYKENNLLLTAGIGTRYRFSKHLEALLDITFNQGVWGSLPSRRLTSATALGLRYRFGQR